MFFLGCVFDESEVFWSDVFDVLRANAVLSNFIQAYAGFESFSDVLELSLAYVNENSTSQYVWRDILNAVDRVSLIVSERDQFEVEEQRLAHFVRKLLEPLMTKLGYTPQHDGCRLCFYSLYLLKKS